MIITDEKSNLILTNALGQVVLQSYVTSAHTEIDVSNLSDGIYFIELNTLNGVLSKKVVISR
jgi:hypothetical protein